MIINGNALLIEEDPSTQGLTAPEIEKNFENVFTVTTIEQAQECLKNHKIEFVFYCATPEINEDFIDQCHKDFPSIIFTILVNDQFHKFLKIFTERPYLKNFISCVPNWISQDLDVTLKKYKNQNNFGLGHYFSPDIRIHSIKINSSKEKEHYIQEALDYLKGSSASTSLLARLGNILDELMMNILWDAPRDKEGKALYNDLPRSHAIELDDTQAGIVNIAFDKDKVAVSASDPFGALKLEKILSYLTKCFYSEQQIGSEGGGAGLGLYMLYKLSNNFTLNVHPGKKTEFILLFKLKFSAKRLGIQKSFHYYEVNDE